MERPLSSLSDWLQVVICLCVIIFFSVILVLLAVISVERRAALTGSVTKCCHI